MGLSVSDLQVDLGTFALGPIDLDVSDHGYLVVLGRSGIGKTVLLETLAGRHRPFSGRITLDGVDLIDLPPERRGIGFVYQDYSLFAHMRVLDNITFGLRMSQVGRKTRNAEAQRFADSLGIEHLLGRYPKNLSGGEKQRVALARALIMRPSLLLLDEPLSALDYATKRETRHLLKRVQADFDPIVVHVTHDLDEALSCSDTIAVLGRGGLSLVEDDIADARALEELLSGRD